MGNLPEVSLRWSHPRGRDLLLRHRHRVQPTGRLPRAGPVQLQTPHPLQGHAGGVLPGVALLPGPRVESCSSCGGAAVRGGECDPAARAGAPER